MSLALLAVILSCASLLLHYIAPRTKNKYDDKAAELVDAAKEYVEGKGEAKK